jgi:hypothetical protein
LPKSVKSANSGFKFIFYFVVFVADVEPLHATALVSNKKYNFILRREAAARGIVAEPP